MPKRIGNPNWGKPLEPVPARPTQFEKMAKKLGLSEEQYLSSTTLRLWAEKNKSVRYIPSQLLKAWGLSVTDDAA